jgi:hypothetical protein
MSLLKPGSLSPWDSVLFVEVKSKGGREHKIRPDLNCNRIMRKNVCNRVNCRFAPCVFQDLKEMQ